jgi:hypothetical protein
MDRLTGWLEGLDRGVARLTVLATALLLFLWSLMAGTALLGFSSGWWPLVGGILVVGFLVLFEVLLHEPAAVLSIGWVRVLLGLAGLLRSLLAVLALLVMTRELDRATRQLDGLPAAERWQTVWDYLVRIVTGG